MSERDKFWNENQISLKLGAIRIRQRNRSPFHRQTTTLVKWSSGRGRQSTFLGAIVKHIICNLKQAYPGLYNDLVKNDFWISSEHCINILNTTAQQNERWVVRQGKEEGKKEEKKTRRDLDFLILAFKYSSLFQRQFRVKKCFVCDTMRKRRRRKTWLLFLWCSSGNVDGFYRSITNLPRFIYPRKLPKAQKTFAWR